MAQVEDEGLLLGGQVAIGAMHVRCGSIHVLTGVVQHLHVALTGAVMCHYLVLHIPTSFSGYV